MSGPPASAHADVPIEREAARWVMLMNERALDTDESKALADWRSADPRHDRIFCSMARTWSDLDNCEAPQPDLAAAADIKPISRRNRFRRPALVGGAVAAAAALFVMLGGLRLVTPAETHATAIAQTDILTLPDGSVVTLGANSRVDIRYSDGERRVVLESGEAFFEVAHNEARPFFVEAGGTLVRVVGTKFNVNRSDGRVSVSVLEGVVQVDDAPALSIARRDPQTLRAGQVIEMPVLSPIAFSAPVAAARSTVAVPGAWRDGRLDYDNVPLGVLVADINRYYEPGVRLEDPALAELRVTASFRTDEVGGILDVLDHALPIDVSRAANGSFVMRAAPRTPPL